jgi:NitT/TauT family transport system permease protein
MSATSIARPTRRIARLNLSALGTRGARLLVPLVLLAGWEAFSRSGILPRSLLPPPSDVLWSWLDWIADVDDSSQSYAGHWLSDAGSSAARVAVGFGLATLIGVATGVIVGWSRLAETLVEPTIQALRPIPPVSWIPLAIIWFGIANKPAIFLVFLGAFFPVFMNTVHGVKGCDRNLVRAGAMMGGRPWPILRHIIFPAALPSIFAGLRIAIGSAWMLTVTAEMVAVKSGLGYVLWDSYYFLRFDLVLAAMASIGLLGFLSDLLIKTIAARTLHWQRGTTLSGRG